MHRGLIRFGAAALALTIALVGSPAGAVVVDPVRTEIWIQPQCAMGALTSVRIAQDAVQVLGTARECGNHVNGSFFAVGVYHLSQFGAEPFASVEDARFFRKGESRDFAIEVFHRSRPDTVCLLASPIRRLACADITTAADGTVTMQPRSITDPRLSRPVKFGYRDPAGDWEGLPACATCF